MITQTQATMVAALRCVSRAANVSGLLIDRKRKNVTPTKLYDEIERRDITMVSIAVHPPQLPETFKSTQCI